MAIVRAKNAVFERSGLRVCVEPSIRILKRLPHVAKLERAVLDPQVLKR